MTTPDPLGNATTALDHAFDLLAAAADLLNAHAATIKFTHTGDTGVPNSEMRLAMQIAEFLDGRLR